MAEFIYAGDGGAYKDCTKCGQLKPSSCFGPKGNVSFGLRSDCKACGAAAASAYVAANAEKAAASRLASYRRTRESRGLPSLGVAKCERCSDEFTQCSQSHKFCEDCGVIVKAERRRAANARYEEKRTSPRVRDPEERRRANEKYVDSNRETVLSAWRSYNEANRDEINRKSRERNKTPKRRDYMRVWDASYRATPKNRVDQRMKAGIQQAIRGMKAGRTWESIVGYTLEDLCTHLERQFRDGMSWENIGEWHIDHIRPRVSFSYENEQDPEFKACWALSNLQPLWARENLSKGAKILHLI